jgi:hypothetical protein
LANFSGIVKQLSKERDRLHQQLSGLNAEDIGQRPGQHCRRPESTLGEGEGHSRSSKETNDASLGSAQNRSGSTGKMGQAQASEKSRLKKTKAVHFLNKQITATTGPVRVEQLNECLCAA